MIAYYHYYCCIKNLTTSLKTVGRQVCQYPTCLHDNKCPTCLHGNHYPVSMATDILLVSMVTIILLVSVVTSVLLISKVIIALIVSMVTMVLLTLLTPHNIPRTEYVTYPVNKNNYRLLELTIQHQ